MKKQIFITIFASIFIIFSVLFIREFFLTSVHDLKKSEVITRDEAISLISKGKDYNNYSIHITTKIGEEEFYYKNKILTHYINDKLDYWMDLNEGKEQMIHIDNETNIAKITPSIINPFNNTERIEFYSIIPDLNNYDFQALGSTIFNERKTYVVKLINKNKPNIFTSYQNIYFIDSETGVMAKIINKTKICNLTFKQKVIDRHIQFNNVKDELIQKPDLDKITNIYTEEMPYISVK